MIQSKTKHVVLLIIEFVRTNIVADRKDRFVLIYEPNDAMMKFHFSHFHEEVVPYSLDCICLNNNNNNNIHILVVASENITSRRQYCDFLL